MTEATKEVGVPFKYATCEACEREMTPSGGCTEFRYHLQSAKTKRGAKNRAKFFRRVPNMRHENSPCHDCGAAYGRYHHPSCDSEVCPSCGGQLLSCGCGDPVEEKE